MQNIPVASFYVAGVRMQGSIVVCTSLGSGVLGLKYTVMVHWAGMGVFAPLKSAFSSLPPPSSSFLTVFSPLRLLLSCFPTDLKSMRRSVEIGMRYWSQRSRCSCEHRGPGWECELYSIARSSKRVWRTTPIPPRGSHEMVVRVSSLWLSLR